VRPFFFFRDQVFLAPRTMMQSLLSFFSPFFNPSRRAGFGLWFFVFFLGVGLTRPRIFSNDGSIMILRVHTFLFFLSSYV